MNNIAEQTSNIQVVNGAYRRLREQENYGESLGDWGYEPSSGQVYLCDFGTTGSSLELSVLAITDATSNVSHETIDTDFDPPSLGIKDDTTATSMVHELRRKSGLSWDQVSRILGVTRRTVHNWAAGTEISAKNHEQLGQILSAIRYVDRGTADDNRSLLLGVSTSGATPFELLVKGALDQVRQELGKGKGRPTLSEWAPIDLAQSVLSGPESIRETLDSVGEEIENDKPVIEVANPRYKRLKMGQG